MSQFKILLTGDYWHDDFQSVLQENQCPLTLTPFETLCGDLNTVAGHSLVVIACSRRDQFPADQLESIVQAALPSSVVLLLGSWCEGESRSGDPAPGIQRVYWHQWQGRIDRFARSLNDDSLNQWQLPRTANNADQILTESPSGAVGPEGISRTELSQKWLGVSASTEHSFDMVRDAVKTYGWEATWIEYTTWEAQEIPKFELIFVDANSWSPACEKRVQWIREELGDFPIVLLLNFPRSDELKEVARSGVNAVVSKPFQLADINTAIEKSLGQATVKP